jgi:acyl CoA:acetate/3-ketoacid CoA transferase alpha subunit
MRELDAVHAALSHVDRADEKAYASQLAFSSGRFDEYLAAAAHEAIERIMEAVDAESFRPQPN